MTRLLLSVVKTALLLTAPSSIFAESVQELRYIYQEMILNNSILDTWQSSSSSSLKIIGMASIHPKNMNRPIFQIWHIGEAALVIESKDRKLFSCCFSSSVYSLNYLSMGINDKINEPIFIITNNKKPVFYLWIHDLNYFTPIPPEISSEIQNEMGWSRNDHAK